MTVHGFQLVEERSIPEINTQAKLYRHEMTGARLLALENDDENKDFGISFATLPAASARLVASSTARWDASEISLVDPLISSARLTAC